MTKKTGKKINSVLLRLQVLNILLFILIFYLFDLFYLIWGYPKFIFNDINTVKSYEMVLYRQVTEKVEPFVQITIILILIFNLYVLIKFLKSKKLFKKYFLINVLNILIVSVDILVIIAGIFRIISSNGVLG